MDGNALPFEFDGLRYIGSFAPLFVHQYSQAWFDFRDQRDQYAGLLSELDHCHGGAIGVFVCL